MKQIIRTKGTPEDFFYLLWGICAQIGEPCENPGDRNEVLLNIRARLIGDLESSGYKVSEEDKQCYWVQIGYWEFPNGIE